MLILISITALSMRNEQIILPLKIVVLLMILFLLDWGFYIWIHHFLIYIIYNNGSLAINFVKLCQNFSFLNGLENEIKYDYKIVWYINERFYPKACWGIWLWRRWNNAVVRQIMGYIDVAIKMNSSWVYIRIRIKNWLQLKQFCHFFFIKTKLHANWLGLQHRLE